MKQLLCVLMILCLLAAVPIAGAGAEEWTEFESRFGFTLWYPEAEMECCTEDWIYCLTEPRAECFYPVNDHSGVAEMVCLGSRYSVLQWDDFTRVSIDEPEAELNYPFELTVYTDGDVMVEQWIVGFAEADQVFILQYEVGDYQHWADLFHSVLETLEFPNQPAEFHDDLRLDFFQGGAAGMRFTDVIVDAEAEPVVLLPLRELRDFSLNRIIWNEDTFEPIRLEPLYTADRLSPGDNLKISCWFSDVLPDLCVQYTDAEGVSWSLSLFQSGMDGSLLLIPEDAF